MTRTTRKLQNEKVKRVGNFNDPYSSSTPTPTQMSEPR